jgi:cytochrome c oxidase cbb3-type subunit 3
MENENNQFTPEENKLLLPYDFDGIRELDNDPPSWFMYLFYITIFFAVIYIFHFHIFKQGAMQDQEYEEEVAAAKAALQQNQDPAAAAAVVAFTDAENLAAGKTIYTEKLCATCHGNLGEGNAIGPNLTDDSWIHGGSYQNILDIITIGAPAKGMTPFKDQLKPEQIAQVSSYVVSLQGSNPANAKAPQGEKYVPVP